MYSPLGRENPEGLRRGRTPAMPKAWGQGRALVGGVQVSAEQSLPLGQPPPPSLGARLGGEKLRALCRAAPEGTGARLRKGHRALPGGGQSPESTGQPYHAHFL